MVIGHLVEATIEIDPGLDESRRWPPIAPGNRSLVYQFESLETPGTDTGFEGMIETAEETETGLLVRIRFLRETAAIYATTGVVFKVWYGGVIGAAVVLQVVE